MVCTTWLAPWICQGASPGSLPVHFGVVHGRQKGERCLNTCVEIVLRSGTATLKERFTSPIGRTSSVQVLPTVDGFSWAAIGG